MKAYRGNRSTGPLIVTPAYMDDRSQLFAPCRFKSGIGTLVPIE